MLMECLAAGRAISLPSSATAGTKAMLRFTSAYGRIRKQFGLPVARMEGVEEPLARMVEAAYANEAARAVTAAMVSRGERPSVISALMKYQTTERMRRSVNDAFDIHGGRAICDGPSNYLQSAYQMVPVGITVEGANILTRTLITFAQGRAALPPLSLPARSRRCRTPTAERGLEAFAERLLRSRRLLGGERDGRLLPQHHRSATSLPAPEQAYEMAHWYRQLGRAARNFAFVADLTVAVAGRRPEDQAEDLRPSRRRAVRALFPRLRPEALRGRWAPVERPRPRGARRRQRALPLPGGAARRRRQFPRHAGALADARRRASRSAAPTGRRAMLSRPPLPSSSCSRRRRCAIA